MPSGGKINVDNILEIHRWTKLIIVNPGNPIKEMYNHGKSAKH